MPTFNTIERLVGFVVAFGGYSVVKVLIEKLSLSKDIYTNSLVTKTLIKLDAYYIALYKKIVCQKKIIFKKNIISITTKNTGIGIDEPKNKFKTDL